MQQSDYAFQEFPWAGAEPDPRSERLCSAAGRERIRIDCALEGGRYAPLDVPPKDEIVVLAYNVERGHHADEQIRLLLDDADIPRPDVLLLSEADRGCSRTGYRHVLRDYARTLGMYYVYGVEFVELPRLWGPGGCVRGSCEHGNGILSRYPLGNVRLMRHAANRSWYNPLQRLLRLGEPRLGGRMALAADVKIGARFLRLYSVHLESGNANDDYRLAQAVEVAEDGLASRFGAIIGGDINTGRYLADVRDGTALERVTQALFQRGYVDAHAAHPPERRITTRSGVIIDVIFGRGVEFVESGVGSAGKWRDVSDHVPVWALVRLP